MSLENVQAGNKLIHFLSYGREKEVVIVERVTKTQIVTKRGKFRKRDGCEIGSSGWHSTCVQVPKAGELEEVARAQRHCSLVYHIGTACERNKLKELSLETLELIYKAIQDAKEEINPS
jgi:hypothetical protein